MVEAASQRVGNSNRGQGEECAFICNGNVQCGQFGASWAIYTRPFAGSDGWF